MVYRGSVLGLHSPSKADNAFKDNAKDSTSISTESASGSAMAPTTFALSKGAVKSIELETSRVVGSYFHNINHFGR